MTEPTDPDTVRRLDERAAAHRARAAAGEQPLPGETYVDHADAVLRVESVRPADPLGRQVRGRLVTGDPPREHAYSCPLTTWARRWRDGEPPTPPSEQSAA